MAKTYTADELKDKKNSELVDIYNGIANKPVKKFASSADGIKRILKAQSGGDEPKAEKAPKTPKAAKEPKGPKPVNFEPGPELKAPRAGSKRAQVLELISAKGGASLGDIVKALKWEDKPSRARNCLSILAKVYGQTITERDGTIRA